MTYFKHIILCAATCTAMFFSASGQIINDWSTGTSLPRNGDNKIISSVSDGINASTYQFLDWEHTLGDFADIKTVTEQEIASRIRKEEARKGIYTIDGRELPSFIDENGIDLYMLTEEGIKAYMSFLNPAFGQQPTPDVIKWIRFYAYNKRQNTQKMFKRYEKWEPHIQNCFEYHGIPKEIAILCLIESACTYNALSKAGALGMWQIMPATGRQFGMTVNEQMDERKDPVKSTETAAKILKYNYANSGDWTNSIAGYNCGIGKVNGIAKQMNTQDWSSIKSKLPKETQQYIPSLMAIYYVWSYRKQLGF